MAVYSQFATGSFDGESIVANESYVGAIGAYQMMAESSMNEHAIFEHVLGCDFVEAQANHGYVSESTLEAVNEASGKGIFSKVIAFFKKLGEKIKGIIQNMINKISAMFTKDGKQLVKKFEETIRKKAAADAYDNNFKYKWCKLKTDITANAADIESTIFGIELKGSGNSAFKGKNIKNMLDDKYFITLGHSNGAEQYKRHHDQEPDDDNNKKDREKQLAQRIKDDRDKDNSDIKTINQDDIDEYKEDMLSALLGSSTDTASFAKDMDEKYFDTEETIEGISDFSEIKNFLSNESKLTRDLDKAKRDVDKQIKVITDAASKIEKAMDRASGKGGFGVNGKLAQTMATNVSKMGNVCSACNSMYFSALGAAVKKQYSQCRAVYVKAATYNKKSAKNEAAMLEAVVDVSNYEVDQMMPEF